MSSVGWSGVVRSGLIPVAGDSSSPVAAPQRRQKLAPSVKGAPHRLQYLCIFLYLPISRPTDPSSSYYKWDPGTTEAVWWTREPVYTALTVFYNGPVMEPRQKKVIVLRHVPHEHLGTLAEAFSSAGLCYEYVNFYEQSKGLHSLDDAAALLILGGPMNVDETDRYPFLAREVASAREAVERKLPVLGICLGAQLIAKALGARVYANREKEIGWYEVERTPAAADDPLFCGFHEKETVFQWHGDTFDLPVGATLLARSPACRHQAFRYGSNGYGLQFHVEVTEEMIREWLCEPVNCAELAHGREPIDPARIEVETPAYLPRLRQLAASLYVGFFEDLRAALEMTN